MRWFTRGFRLSECFQNRRALHVDRVPAVLLGLTVLLVPAASAAGEAELVELGEKVYNRNCIICHGANGDGKGLMGVIHRAQQSGIVVAIYPRDFTAAMFKFRSTETGELPTNDDLLATVTDGIARSGMPSHKDLSLRQRRAVVEYIKTFSKRWEEEQAPQPITISAIPDYVGTAESSERGKEVYEMMQCYQCHGTTGRGDGPSSHGLEDNWGDKILPFDFTSGPLKGGSTPEKIYRTFVTGLDGTPMPSFADSLSEPQRWNLVSYCLDLMKPAVVSGR